MDVIGDNIANVNTVGFKSSRVTFASVFASVLKSASAPDTASGRGGSNPMQIGLGVSVASVDMNMTRGSLQRTDNPTDLAIEGDGFFVVGGDGKAPRFTRAGNFSLDKMGNLVTATGLNVLGWMYDPVNNQIDTTKSPSKINILAFPTLPPKATDQIIFSGNLDSSKKVVVIPFDITGDGKIEENEKISGEEVYNKISASDMSVVDKYQKILNKIGDDMKSSISFKIFDSQGGEHTLSLTFVKYDSNKWFWIIDSPRKSNNYAEYLDDDIEGADTNFIAFGTIEFDNEGRMTSVELKGGQNIDGTKFTIKFKNNSLKEITFDTSKGNTDETLNIFKFDDIKQYSLDSSIRTKKISGYAAGSLQGFNVDATGKIIGVYSNGLNQLIGQIAIATFANPSGLQRIGDNLYINTPNSGDPEIGIPGTGSRGTIFQGTLEMSNVDLAKEFTDMIVTQRGYQANARVITASDELLQDLVNIKR
jgi:flagellar hook protein FlgE